MSWSVDVTPLNDLKKHDHGEKCWCNPSQTEEGCWVHNASDERELTEDKPRA